MDNIITDSILRSYVRPVKLKFYKAFNNNMGTR